MLFLHSDSSVRTWAGWSSSVKSRAPLSDGERERERDGEGKERKIVWEHLKLKGTDLLHLCFSIRKT